MIISCGEALVDLVAGSGSGVRVVPGGGPLNVAVAVARLGVPSAFVGRVSTDEYGEQIWRYLTENGVDLRACERGPEPTARAIVEHTPKLKFRFEGDNTADTQLSVADLSLLAASSNISVGTRILHGGTLGMFRGRTAETLANLVEVVDLIAAADEGLTFDADGVNAILERLEELDRFRFSQVVVNDPDGSDFTLLQFNASTGDQDRREQLVLDLVWLWYGDRSQITITSGEIISLEVT